jgi:excisionase family DNA binding protein
MDTITTIENWGRFLTIPELANLTSIDCKTLYRYVKLRKLPALRIVGNIRLNPATTAEWLRSRQG